jgi:hypothetical protein
MLNEPIAILYGGNGSGKTTILTFLFHLLTTEVLGGHRSWLARVPIESFIVTLLDETQISLRRDPKMARRIQNYIYSLQISTSSAIPPKSWHITRKDLTAETQTIEEYCEALRAIKTGVYLLTDTRELLGNPFYSGANNLHQVSESAEIDFLAPVEDAQRRLGENIYQDILINLGRSGSGRNARNVNGPSNTEVVTDRAIHRFHQWALNEARRSSSRGEQSAHSIYARIIQHLQRGDLVGDAQGGVENISDKLRELSKGLVEYEAFGIVPELDIMSMIDSLERLPAQTRAIAGKILSPYVESMEQRMNEHKKLKDILEAFTAMLDDFYSHKRVSYSLS